MNPFNKAMLAGIIAAAFCAPAFSDEAATKVDAPAAEVQAAAPAKPAQQVKKQDVASNLPAHLVKELESSGQHNKEIDELRRKQALAQAESELAKAELERDKNQLELKRLSDPSSVPPAADMSGGFGYNSAPQGFAPSPTSLPVIDVVAPKEDDSSVLDEIYVTRIYVFGDKKSATVYIKNSVSTAEIGDEVAPGVKLTAITDKAVTFTSKGKKKTVRLSTQEQAYGRSYEPKASSGIQSGMQPSRSLTAPMGMPSGMSMPSGMTMQNMNPSVGSGPSNMQLPKGLTMPTNANLPSKLSAPPGF